MVKENNLSLYNTLTRSCRPFHPIQEGHVGMYVCGPTVYGDAHLGHARPAITFDILFRYLRHLGYKVRYVRNITDVGHLEHDADEGRTRSPRRRGSRCSSRWRWCSIISSAITGTWRLSMSSPVDRTHASGHIIEQIEYIKKILESGYAYESCGSVYFDVSRYNADHHYGKLSGRNIDDLLSTTRALDGQEEKRNPLDFALWKKAAPEHIMHWPSPWSEGFPGWHLECSTMGRKYLGDMFDIHGGGMDLMFPHHECEIAQSVAAQGHEAVKCWMHNNMITIDGKKMGKSYGNFITLEQFFTGDHPLLTQAFSPMVIRYFILQAHYRSVVNFSSEALQAAEKALGRLQDAYMRLQALNPAEKSTEMVPDLMAKCYEALDDDLNTPNVISVLFEAVKIINSAADGLVRLDAGDIARLKELFDVMLGEILGIRLESVGSSSDSEAYKGAVDLLMEIRANAKQAKDWTTSDLIRDKLAALGFSVKDTKNGVEWSVK